MTAHKNQSFPRRVRFALGGLTHGLRAENSLKIQAAVFVVAVIAMLILRPGPLWWARVAARDSDPPAWLVSMSGAPVQGQLGPMTLFVELLFQPAGKLMRLP